MSPVTVKNISENDPGFYLDHEESKKLFREISRTETMPSKETLDYLSKRSRKTTCAVRIWFNRERKKVMVNSKFINNLFLLERKPCSGK